MKNMNIDFDFHVHSNYSTCAIQSVEQAVEKAFSEGIKVMALCDHNCIDGLEAARAQCKKRGMSFINGVEMSAMIYDEVIGLKGKVCHVLGYGIKNDKTLFNQLLFDVQNYDRERRKAIVHYLVKKRMLKEEKAFVSDKELREELCLQGAFISGKAAKEFLNSQEITDCFPIKKLPLSQVVPLIHNLGGIAVLAHPIECENHDRLSMEQMLAVIEYLVKSGIDGIEIFHQANLADMEICKKLISVSEQYNLKVTFGSDRHRNDNKYSAEYFSFKDKLNGIQYDFNKIRQLAHSLITV